MRSALQLAVCTTYCNAWHTHTFLVVGGAELLNEAIMYRLMRTPLALLLLLLLVVVDVAELLDDTG